MSYSFGMPTLLEANSVTECAEICKNCGLGFIEINMNLPQYQANLIYCRHFKEIADRYGVYYTIHLDENINVCDFNPYIAEAYLRTVADTINVAKQLNAPIINMHLPCGVHFTLPDKKIYLFEKYNKFYNASAKKFIEVCEETIGNSPIKICIENCSGFADFQIEIINMFLKSPVFGLTFDVGHNYNCDGKDEQFILQNITHLKHMHLHDAQGGRAHLSLGTGALDIKKYIELSQRYNCSIVLETKTVDGLQQSVEWLKANGYKI